MFPQTAGNHPKTFIAVNTVYMTKQGTHIQFQLVTVCYQRDSKQNKKKQKHHHQLYHAFSSNMLVSNIRPALTLIYKLGGKSDLCVKPKHTHTQKREKKQNRNLWFTFRL